MSESSAEFTVRLIDQVMGPAKSIQKVMGSLDKSIGTVKRSLEAPVSKRGVVSDWDKMLSKAKLSQIKDFSRSRVAAMKPPKMPAQEEPGGGGGGGLLAMLGMSGPEGAAVAAVAALTVGIIKAAEAVVSLGTDFVETALEAGRFAEDSTKAIGYLTDNALHAGTVFDDVRHLAQDLGLDVRDTVGGFQKLLAAQFTVGEAKGLIKMGADLRAIGATAQDVSGILFTMSEIKNIGTLQGRQKRMLEQHGLSGELIDQALMKRTGIKTKGGLALAQKKGMINADTAVAAIQDAVMAKTHESALGEVGKKRADSTFSGMLNKFKAGVDNFWTNVGILMEPGAVRVAKLVEGTIGRVMDDPKLIALGTTLLKGWNDFSVWVQARWPTIENLLIDGLHVVSDAVTFIAANFSAAKPIFEIMGIAMLGLGATAVVAAAAIGAIVLVTGLLAAAAVGVGAAIGWGLAFLADNALKWYKAGRDLVGGLIDGILSMLGPLGNVLSFVGSSLAILQGPAKTAPPQFGAPTNVAPPPLTQIAPDWGNAQAAPAAGLPANSSVGSGLLALAGLGSGKTEASNPASGAVVHVGEITTHVTAAAGEDPNVTGAKIGAQVRAELQKVFATQG